MPRVGRDESALAETPSICSVSALAMPNAPKNKANKVKIRSLDITATPLIPVDYITPSLAKKQLISKVLLVFPKL
jgi:hypothetical protein